jgi:hypothetical protein
LTLPESYKCFGHYLWCYASGEMQTGVLRIIVLLLTWNKSESDLVGYISEQLLGRAKGRHTLLTDARDGVTGRQIVALYMKFLRLQKHA